MSARTPSVQPAYVLHQHDWSESSLILDLFTRESGRVAVAAKGAKRPYSQLRAVLLPLQRITVSLSKPAKTDGGEVQTLRSAEWGGGATLPSGAALFSGYYLNELLLKLLARHDPHPRLLRRRTGPPGRGRRGAARLRAQAAGRAGPAARPQRRHAHAGPRRPRAPLPAVARIRRRPADERRQPRRRAADPAAGCAAARQHGRAAPGLRRRPPNPEDHVAGLAPLPSGTPAAAHPRSAGGRATTA